MMPTPASAGSFAAGCLVIALLVSLGTVRAAIAYAQRKGLLDEPGRRRSHTLPTPRGGGIGIVLAVLVSMPAAFLLFSPFPGPGVVAAFTVGVIAVAAIGWLDDHGSLPIKPRLFIQLAATLLFCAAVAWQTASLWWALPLLLAGVWCINLHNFMDGIDGIAALQAVFFGLATSRIADSAGAPLGIAVAASAMAMAALGFWWFNRSPARIFMGDVGSATLGFIVFALTAVLWAWRTDLLWPELILSSAFVIDATLTLLVRMLRGARWYTPHREHLYQWLVRRGETHTTVSGWYLVWNLLVCSPGAWIALRHPAVAPVCCVAVYVLGAAAWCTGKRRCLRRRERHVSA